MTSTRKTITAAAVVTAAEPALAACSSSPSPATAPVAVAAAQAPANPVPLLAATGAALDPGEVLGNADIEGDRYASGSYPGGEGIAVYTFASPAAQAADLARNGIPGDAHAIITTRLADYYLTAVQNQAGAYVFTVTPAQVAALVKGKVVSP